MLLTWLADCLRQAGLTVIECPGWETRGRPSGAFGPMKGVLAHHTGSNPRGGAAPDLQTCIKGRPDLAGPLCHLLLDRNAVWHVIAAGRCNHAGEGSWHGVTDGNAHLIGIEAENDGVREAWSTAEMESYVHGVAALLTHIGADSVMCAGHKEYALPRGRKVDPDFDMVAFRDHVEAIMALGHAPAPVAVAKTDPERSMLRKGDQGDSVKELQRALGIKDDGFFGPATRNAVQAFQAGHGLVVDGLVGPTTWKALGH